MLYAILGFAFGLVLMGFIWAVLRKRPTTHVTVHASIEHVRSVGELVVYRLVTKEIVTSANHAFGETGKRYLSWLISEKKMAMIFELGVEFVYDLRSSDFQIEPRGNESYLLRMPACKYNTHIRDFQFYDEQNPRLLPVLLPDLINRFFGSGFDVADRNKLKDEARHQVDRLARQLVDSMQGEVQRSARQTLEAIARGLGVESVELDFSDSPAVLARIDFSDRVQAQIEGKAAS
ncbi:MAG: DUF4230 domain-containing protein [Phycisphaeraceae bacterium]|nr:DUF4230 domain-containing protein [Phycisphaeraceae bacterium]